MKGGHTDVITSYKKGELLQLSDNFWLQEFDCRCRRPECLITLVDLDHIKLLERLRKSVGWIHLDDGFRCPPHNLEVGGAPHSEHPKGTASDIKTAVGPIATYQAADEIFKNGGLGRYPHFTHVDNRGVRARW